MAPCGSLLLLPSQAQAAARPSRARCAAVAAVAAAEKNRDRRVALGYAGVAVDWQGANAAVVLCCLGWQGATTAVVETCGLCWQALVMRGLPLLLLLLLSKHRSGEGQRAASLGKHS